ncbi:MAG: hypothetical protein JO246_05095 [Frankiaceae bacterium]|nr:hypothetical protein [Frankiaceae bacterium]MBV9870539.1 hypothetical protein [Frankiaceae bacterium]
MKRTHVITAAICGAATSVAFATAAPAAVERHPKAGHYAQMNKSGSKFKMEFTLKKHKVSDAIHYDHCVVVPLLDMPKIKVKGGKFSFDGTVNDVTSNKFKVHLDGKFTSKTKAKGNWTAKKLGKDSCTSKFNYKVKRVTQG